MGKALDELNSLMSRVEARRHRKEVEERIDDTAQKLREVQKRIESLGGVDFLRSYEQGKRSYETTVAKLTLMRRNLDEEARQQMDQILLEAERELISQKDSAERIKECIEELHVYVDRWQQHRRKYKDPSFFENHQDVDELCRRTELPLGGQIRDLLEEIQVNKEAYARLPKTVQYHQLRLWSATHRKLQAMADKEPDLPGRARDALEDIFPILRDLSGKYQPGFIDCMNKGWTVDQSGFDTWDAYVEHCRQCLENTRLNQ